MFITVLTDGENKTPFEFLEESLKSSEYNIEQKSLLLEVAVNNSLINLNEYFQLIPLLKDVIV